MRQPHLKTLGIAVLLAGLLGVLALFYQSIDVYLTLGDPVTVTSGQEHRYVWTAALTCGAMVACLVCATFAESRPLIYCGVVGLVIAIAASVVFVVPPNRWEREPTVNKLPDNYQPCYSGSNKCN